MPELPEIETIRRSLAPLVTGRRVSRVDVACASLRRPLDPDFGRRLKGRRIERIGRRAKYLVFDLDDGLS
ncbi:MAG: DNA-formamidopyrimidine glycosylase family protein, partial [Deltaproteobacteria bacterium]